MNGQLIPKDAIECAIASSGLGDDFSIRSARRGSQIPLIPESPPPTYQQFEYEELQRSLSINNIASMDDASTSADATIQQQMPITAPSTSDGFGDDFQNGGASAFSLIATIENVRTDDAMQNK